MSSRELALRISKRLQEQGHQALFVGGCVRDLLLHREPADYDVATDATPAEVLSLFPNSLSVGAQFGVVLVQENDAKVEVATFRSDVGYSDGRHPDRVVYAQTPQEDVQRRDFTINGLLMDPASGKILDYIGGQADLKTGVVRAIGDASHRFEEDKLRMIRGVRFAARFGYAIEAQTFAAIQRHSTAIGQVSAERIREELTKLLTEGAPRRGFELLDEAGLLEAVLPEVSRMKGVEQPPLYHPEGDVWIHTRLMLEQLPAGTSPTLAWGVLLHDVGKPPTFRSAAETGDRIRFDRHVEVGTQMTAEICGRLRFSNEDTGQIAALVANHLRFKDAQEMRASTLKRFVRLPRFEEHLELHRLDCLSSHHNLEAHDYVNRFLAETPASEVRPERLITGEDLKRMGLPPGPLFATILRAVEDARLDGEVHDREAALAFAKGRIAGLNPKASRKSASEVT
jgi:poly(A) polymerase